MTGGEIGPIRLRRLQTSWIPPKQILPAGSTRFSTGENLRRHELLRYPLDAQAQMAPGLNIRAVKLGMVFFTSSPIINETISRLQSRGYFSAALTFLDRVRRNEGVQIVHPDPELQAEAWDLFWRWESAGAFAFDAHFRATGFETLGTRPARS
jgi:hypothetical protein